MGYPKSVLDAQKIDFGSVITGYLCCVTHQRRFVVGIVFSDQRGRFRDGATIRTSLICAVQIHLGYLICETFIGSRYVVCHWQDENGSSPESRIIHKQHWRGRDLHVLESQVAV